MTFTFKLAPKQAQNLFDVTQCFLEEPQLVNDTFRYKKGRAKMRAAIRCFEKQLHRQYQETGIEV
jgi:hypothetical protein